MSDSEKPHGTDNEIRPEEYGYLIGWFVLCCAGGYFIYRGLVESSFLKFGGGIIAILAGISFAAVIAIKPLRSWKKIVGLAWTILLLLIFFIVLAFDVFERVP